MITKLSKLEQKLGSIDQEDLQALSVDSPDNVYLKLLGNFEKKYGDTYRISDWLGDIRENLVLVLLLKIEALSARLDDPMSTRILTNVCDTVRICLREPMELAHVQVEHVLISIVAIIRAQVSIILTTAALRLLLNILNRQPSRMLVFLGPTIRGIQVLSELILYGHRDCIDSQWNEASTAIERGNTESDQHECQVKLIHHAVRIVFMIICESERCLATIRGFISLSSSCAKRLFLCLSNHFLSPSELQNMKISNFPFSEVNALLFCDLVKVLCALDNICSVTTLGDRLEKPVPIRKNIGSIYDVDNNESDSDSPAIRLGKHWKSFIALSNSEVSAYGVAEPITGAKLNNSNTDSNLEGSGIDARPLGDNERAMNASSLEEIRITLVSQFRSRMPRNSVEDNEPSSNRTLVRVMQQSAADTKQSQVADAKNAYDDDCLGKDGVDCYDIIGVPVELDEVDSESEYWSPLALVAVSMVVVLSLGPCHLQPPLLFSEEQQSSKLPGSRQRSNSNGSLDSVVAASVNSGTPSVSRPIPQRAESSNASYRQVYQLVVGRLTEIEEIVLQLSFILPDNLIPAFFLLNYGTHSDNNQMDPHFGDNKGTMSSSFSAAKREGKADSKNASKFVEHEELSGPFSSESLDVVQARKYLQMLCRSRLPWLPDSIYRILYRLLLKSRRSISSTSASFSQTPNTASAALLPAIVLLTKIQRYVFTHNQMKGTSTLAQRCELDNLRYALKHRVFPTPFDRSQHVNLLSTSNSTSGQGLSKNSIPMPMSARLSSRSGADTSQSNKKKDDLAPWDCPPDTLRSELVGRMTSIVCEGQLSRAISELLFVLCDEDKDEFKVRTGFGNAIHLLQLKGLLS